ncbi:hypothetical protein BRADI_2g40465v3 [Brachypodium distachyon]|uniref:Uncharacterized protein n=1 Tax=Brachypodium distachyon TaxID=15368 RepID=A0A2K2DD07_BRADI|nr:hypothetical protein BRADI_2g40465v3 [Brachypodium distachyon]
MPKLDSISKPRQWDGLLFMVLCLDQHEAIIGDEFIGTNFMHEKHIRISNFLECSKLHLSIQIWINTSKNISEQGSSAMPNVSEKEEQSKGSMTKSEPTPWTAAKKYSNIWSKPCLNETKYANLCEKERFMF